MFFANSMVTGGIRFISEEEEVLEKIEGTMQKVLVPGKNVIITEDGRILDTKSFVEDYIKKNKL